MPLPPARLSLASDALSRHARRRPHATLAAVGLALPRSMALLSPLCVENWQRTVTPDIGSAASDASQLSDLRGIVKFESGHCWKK
jgi:hypothetical protein